MNYYKVVIYAKIGGVEQMYASNYKIDSKDTAEKYLGGTVLAIFKSYPEAVITDAYIELIPMDD